MKHNGFRNKYYQEDWIQNEGYEDGSAYENEEGAWAVFDGRQNYMGKVDPATGDMESNGEMTQYKESFLRSALEALTEEGKDG